jgi:hypothetical protein
MTWPSWDAYVRYGAWIGVVCVIQRASGRPVDSAGWEKARESRSRRLAGSLESRPSPPDING